MKKPWVIAIPFLLVLLFSPLHSQQKAGGGIESFSVNGLTVILKAIDANDIIAANLYVRGGAGNLTDATEGIESFLFNCAVKGSREYPKDKLNALLDRTAAGINSNVGKDMSSIGLRCVKSDFNVLWDAFADVVMHPLFVPEDVNVVRNNMLLSIRQRHDNPDSYLSEVSDDVFYAGHPYRFDPNGSDSSITSLTIDQMKKYLAENLVTSKLLLVVVGNISRADIEKKVRATLGTLPKGAYVSRLPDPVGHAVPSLKVIERPLPTNYVRGMFTLPSPGDPDYYAAMVMMSILRDRVFEEVRTKRNLSYAPAAGMLNRFANAGMIYVTAVNPDSAVKVMLGELTRMQKEPVSPKDLKDRITLFLTSYNLQRETNESQAQFLAFHEIAGLGWEAAAHFVERTREVTAADIQKVAMKYFHNIQFVIIGNPTLVNRTVYAY